MARASGPAAGPATGEAPDAGRRGSPWWPLLPAAWCLWLLLWLVPSLLVAPDLATRPVWVTAASAPSALVVAGAFFLVVVWPFWPALADRAAAGADRVSVGWLLRSLAELVVLVALAVPFALVGWSVANRAVEPGPVAAAVGSLVLLGLAIRLASVGIGPESGRWLMLGAMLAAAGPILVAYGVHEVMRIDLAGLVDLSPAVAAIRLCREGWPETGWERFVRLVLWPAASAVLVFVALSEMAWRRRRHLARD